MKTTATTLLTVLLVGFGQPVSATTNDLSTLLQRGLFEEEGNRDVPAAIAVYESLIEAFERDRRLAATAVFRLGECYRKLGQTNEAVAYYRKVLRQFPEEPMLNKLSAENLTLLGMAEPADGTADTTPALATAVVMDEEEQEIRRLQAILRNSPDLINTLGAVAGDTRIMTPLARAAGRGQLRVVQFLLDHSAEVALRTTAGQTPLHLAAASGHRAIVELLLRRGAAAEARDNAGWTALYEAAGRGYVAVAEVLLAAGADANARAGDGRTPLHRAVHHGQVRMISLLLEHGADPGAKAANGRTPLMVAGMNQHREAIVRQLLAGGADPNVEDEQGRTALSYAVEIDELETVSVLLANGADPNLGVNLPLQVAAHRGSAVIVEVLLKAGADPNRQAGYLYTAGGKHFGPGDPSPLSLAIQRGDFPPVLQDSALLDVVRLLLARGADPNRTTTGGESLVFSALDKPKVLELLIEAGADLEVVDGEGWSPLTRRDGRLGAAGILLKAGVDVNRLGPDGYAPLHHASSGRDVGLLKLLLSHGAEVNIRGPSGYTPLHFAIQHGVAEIVKGLLEAGADPNARNDAGQSPLDLAETAAQSSGPRLATRVLAPRSVDVGPRVALPTTASAPAVLTREDLVELLRQHGAKDE